MATTSRSTTVLAGLADIRGWQEEFYGDLHQHPELAHQEHGSGDQGGDVSLGIQIRRCAPGTGR